jgi:hypothetical protein
VFVFLVILHATRVRRIVVCGLSRSTVFFHIINSTIFGAKKVTEHKMRVLILSTSFV